MKALIKGGLFLALGWLANAAPAQEIQWRASTPKNSNPGAVVPATNTTNPSDTGVRAVGVGQPTRLDAPESVIGSFRPIGAPAAIVRGQAADDKTVPLPNLVIGGDPKPAKPLPKDKGFDPPPPTPMPPLTPSPIFDSLGLNDDACCGDSCGDPCGRRLRGVKWGGVWGGDCCPDRACWWVNAEMLMWWQKSINVPPLVTASPAGQLDNVGVLGDPRTEILYDSVPNRTRGGARFTVGAWLPHFCNVGVEARYFFLNRQNTSATFATDGNFQLARPFYDTEQGTQNAEFSSLGTVTVQTYSQIWGIEGNIRHKLKCGPNYWIDFLWGYRHLNLNEGVSIYEDFSFVDPLGQRFRFTEQETFQTRTQFNGVQFGFDSEWRCLYRCFFGLRATVAMGGSHQIINIDGNTGFFPPPPLSPSGARGALLASTTNIGQYTANRFAVVPEVGLKFGVDITDHLRLYAGYDFLYLSSALRPGDQIDQNVSQSFRPFLNPITGQAQPGVGGTDRRPLVPFRTSDYWAQGFNFGLQYRY